MEMQGTTIETEGMVANVPTFLTGSLGKPEIRMMIFKGIFEISISLKGKPCASL